MKACIVSEGPLRLRVVVDGNTTVETTDKLNVVMEDLDPDHDIESVRVGQYRGEICVTLTHRDKTERTVCIDSEGLRVPGFVLNKNKFQTS